MTDKEPFFKLEMIDHGDKFETNCKINTELARQQLAIIIELKKRLDELMRYKD